MSEAIIVAIITGGISLIGTVITFLSTSKKNEARLETAQAVTNTKIEELSREVREHNNYARRMPVCEEKIRALNERVQKLEKGGN